MTAFVLVAVPLVLVLSALAPFPLSTLVPCLGEGRGGHIPSMEVQMESVLEFPGRCLVTTQ